MTKTLLNKLIPVVLLIGIALIAGCNTFDADFERGNTSDPKSPNFTHSKPERFLVSVENEIVTITWDDRTIYNDGYLVEKAIDDTTQFERFKVLPADGEGFTDKSRAIGLNTYYRISSFEMENGSEKIVTSETLSLSIEVLQDVSMSVDKNNLATIQWSASDNFIDGVRIDYKAVTDSVYSTIVAFENPDDVLVNQFEFDASMDVFNVDVRLVAFQNHEDEKVDFEHVVDTLPINSVWKLDVTFISETETLFEWENNVDFADHYHLEVFHNWTSDFYEMPPTGSFQLNAPQELGFSTYSVKGVMPHDESNYRSNRIRFNIYPPHLSVRSKNLDSIDLSWGNHAYTDGRSVPPSKFILERKTNELDFEMIDEFPPDQYPYTDNNLDASNYYTYRVRTQVSNAWPVAVSNQNIYFTSEESKATIQKSSYYEYEYRFTNQNEFILLKNFGHPKFLSIIDLNTLSVEDTFESGNLTYTLDVSHDGNKMAEFIPGEEYGSYDVKIWDLNNKTIDITLPNVHFDPDGLYSKTRIKFSRDNQVIATGVLGTDKNIKLWDTQSGELVHTLNFPGERLNKFEFSTATDELIVFVEATARIYDLDEFEIQHQLFFASEFSNYTNAFIKNNGNSILITKGRELYEFDLNSDELIKERSFDRTIYNLFANNDGSDIILQFYDGDILLDGETFETIQEFGFDFYAIRGLIALNPLSDTKKAFSMEKGDGHNQWDLKIWERRPHWSTN